MSSIQNTTHPFALIDSHCHLDDRAFEKDLDAVIERAFAAGVKTILNAGIHRDSSRRCVDLSRKYAGLYAAIGFHPHNASECNEKFLRELTDLAQAPGVKAWGEIGLDFNRMFSSREDQEKWFVRQLEVADALQLPVILHERDTEGRLLEMLQQYHQSPGHGVVHCFSGSTEVLHEYLDMGYFIGVTGIISIAGRNRRLIEQVRQIPADRLLIETDAPYLTPVPEKKRYRRNEPAFVASVLTALAQARGDEPATLAATVWANTVRLFNLP